MIDETKTTKAAKAKAETISAKAKKARPAVETKTPFDRAMKKLKKLLIKADEGDVRARHDIGLFVKNKLKEAEYGDEAIKRMEAELGLDETTLRKYGDLASTWTKLEMRSILKLRNSKGLSISWSHLQVIATQDEAKREKLFKAWKTGSLSVRNLQAFAGVETTSPTPLSKKSGSAGNRSPRPNEMQAVANRASDLVDATAKAKDALKKLSSTVTPTPKQLRDLELVRSATRKARDTCNEFLVDLDAVTFPSPPPLTAPAPQPAQSPMPLLPAAPAQVPEQVADGG